MSSFARIYLKDFSNKSTSATIEGEDILPDGTNYTQTLARQDALFTALDVFLNGKVAKFEQGGNIAEFTPAVPTTGWTNDSSSRVNQKLILTYKQNEINYRWTIGCALDSIFQLVTDPYNGCSSYQLDYTTPEWTALKAAWDAYFLRDGGATELVGGFLGNTSQ